MNGPGKKIVAVVSNELEPGLALNVVGHLAASLGAFAEGPLMGQDPLTDASGVEHRGVAQYPFIVLKAKPGHVRKTVEAARDLPDVFMADYPRQMLTTATDEELVQELGQAAEPDLEYLGLLLFGPAWDVDPLTKKFSLWR
jgi:hypothetical protein